MINVYNVSDTWAESLCAGQMTTRKWLRLNPCQPTQSAQVSSVIDLQSDIYLSVNQTINNNTFYGLIPRKPVDSSAAGLAGFWLLYKIVVL